MTVSTVFSIYQHFDDANNDLLKDANTEEEIKQRTDELKALKEHAAELKEIADGQDAEKIRLKQQIRRERAQLTNKKKRESDDGLANRFVISLNDRNVACKSA